MKKHSQLSYKVLQKVKAQEFKRFFEERQTGRYPFLNHLGEVVWMTPEEAELQHEYYEYQEGFWVGLKRKIAFERPPRLDKIAPEERELRLRYRKYLEEHYLGRLTPETAALLPQQWSHPLSDEEIESIPVTLEILESTPWQRTVAVGAILLTILVVGLLAGNVFDSREPTGSIVVEANVRGAGIFLDDSKRGYADFMRMLPDVPVGKHRVRVEKPGYVVTPNMVEVEVFPDSMISIYFNLEPMSQLKMGYLRILADQADSRVFINNDFYSVLAEQPVLPLQEGEYRIALEREGYLTEPGEMPVQISKGDTVTVRFRQRRSFNSATTAKVHTGELSITTNVSGARIYLNGRDTGKATDHFFTELPLGSYTIRVEKEGYKPEPAEQRISLTRSKPHGEVDFLLSKEFENGVIRVTPATAQIYLDDKLLGTGHYQGPLPLGKHRLRFGEAAGYKTPREKEITVLPNTPFTLKVDYFPEIKLIAEVADDGNLNIHNCDFITGYTVGNRGFTASEEAGPEIVYYDRLKNYYWKFGYAFPYRTPKGNDAVRVSFRLPQRINYDHPFVLRFEAAASKERYPLAISRKVEVQIKLNHKILSYYYTPKLLEDINGLEVIEWDITNQIKPGLNNLVITVTDKNNSYYYLKRISISN